MTRFYHRTSAKNAALILATGFKDRRGHYMTNTELEGVWVSMEILDVNEGAHGDVVLILEAKLADLASFECVEEGKLYREFLVPAEVLNRVSKILRVEIERNRDVLFLRRLAKERRIPTKSI